jgi:hypothetical protein
MNIQKCCHICKKSVVIAVSDAQYQAWQNGEVIQKAMPNLTPGEREILISGICERCFDIITRE